METAVETNCQELIQCRQKQWSSGLYKEKYCKDCKNQKNCNELFPE